MPDGPYSEEEKEKARQRQQRIMRRSTLLSFLGVMLFASLGYFLYKTTPSPYEEQLNSVILHSAPTVSMTVLQKKSGGGWTDLDHTPNEGEEVAFKVSTTHPIHVALFAEANHTKKRLIFDYIRIPPGENKILKVNNSPYIYRVAKGEQHVVFCMVVATDSQGLPKALAPVLAQVHLDDLPKTHCASW